jgi:hypothetical protein
MTSLDVTASVAVCPHCLDFDLQRYGKKTLKKPGNYFKYKSPSVVMTRIETAAASGCRGCHVILFAVEPYVASMHSSNVLLSLEDNVEDGFLCSIADASSGWLHNVAIYKSRAEGESGSGMLALCPDERC